MSEPINKQCKLCGSDFTPETHKIKFYCKSCGKNWQGKLSKCQVWETKKKQIISDFLNDNSKELKKEMWELNYMGGVIYGKDDFCQKCNKQLVEKNECGDKKILNHVCSKDDNPRERERESILNYFKKHKIQSITLSNGKLKIKYQDTETETETDNWELKLIESYAKKNNKNELTLKDLEQNNPSQTPNSNKILYWGLGIGVVLVLGVVGWLLVRNKNKSHD